jgi:hypothetical protein
LHDNHSAMMMPMPRGQIPILLLAASNHRLPRYKAAGAEITARSVRGKCAGTSARTVNSSCRERGNPSVRLATAAVAGRACCQERL